MILLQEQSWREEDKVGSLPFSISTRRYMKRLAEIRKPEPPLFWSRWKRTHGQHRKEQLTLLMAPQARKADVSEDEPQTESFRQNPKLFSRTWLHSYESQISNSVKRLKRLFWGVSLVYFRGTQKGVKLWWTLSPILTRRIGWQLLVQFLRVQYIAGSNIQSKSGFECKSQSGRGGNREFADWINKPGGARQAMLFAGKTQKCCRSSKADRYAWRVLAKVRLASASFPKHGPAAMFVTAYGGNMRK